MRFFITLIIIFVGQEILGHFEIIIDLDFLEVALLGVSMFLALKQDFAEIERAKRENIIKIKK